MRSCRLWSVFSSALALSAALLTANARAVVNIDTTRVVFNQHENSQSFTLKNGPDRPVIVQIWSDEGDIMLAPERSKTPVIALPPVLKLAPGEMRSVRLLLTNRQALRPERESLYWLNLYQIPAIASAHRAAERKVVLPLRLRLKILVRPAGLAAPRHADMQRLRVIAQDEWLTLVNPTPWFMTLRLPLGRRARTLTLAPLSQQRITAESGVAAGQRLRVEALDDSGNAFSFETIVAA